VLPVGDTFLYVSPIYLQATQARMPQLKKGCSRRRQSPSSMRTLMKGSGAAERRSAAPAPPSQTPAAPSTPLTTPNPQKTTDPRIDSIRQHFDRYREFSSQGNCRKPAANSNHRERGPEMKIVRSMAASSSDFALFLGIVRFSRTVCCPVSPQLSRLRCSGATSRLSSRVRTNPARGRRRMLMIGTGFVAMRQEGATRPGWYEILIAGCGPVSAMLGAAIRLLTKARRQPCYDDK